MAPMTRSVPPEPRLADGSLLKRNVVEKEPTSWKHHAQLGCTARHCLHVLAPLEVQTFKPETKSWVKFFQITEMI